MEDKDLDMSIFGNNDDLELNYDFIPEGFEDYDENEDDSQEDDSKTKDKNAVENDSSEEVDGDEDEQEDGDEQDEDESDSSSNLYSSITSVLHEQGLLPSLDINTTKIETIDDFVEAFKKEQQIQAQVIAENYLNSLDLESIAKSKLEINKLEQIDSDYLSNNIEVAKQVIFDDYLNQGLSQEKATRLLNRLVDLGEDAILEDAEESLKSLKEFNARKIEQEKEQVAIREKQQQEEQARIDAEIKKAIFERKDLIKGYQTNKALQEKVYKSMNEIVGKSPEGIFENKFMKENRMNPIEFQTRLYTTYELTDGFKDFSKLVAKGKSSAVNDLEKIIKKGAFKDTGSPSWMTDKNSYDINIGDELNY
jgi:hypothetical protein